MLVGMKVWTIWYRDSARGRRYGIVVFQDKRDALASARALGWEWGIREVAVTAQPQWLAPDPMYQHLNFRHASHIVNASDLGTVEYPLDLLAGSVPLEPSTKLGSCDSKL